MEKRLVQRLGLLMLILGLCTAKAWSTSLVPGDIAFTSINADGNQRFSFVLLRDISDSTALYFTDNGWDSTTNTWHNTTEGTILWYFNGVLPCGTEVRIDPTQDTVNLGFVDQPDSGFNISPVGDAILAYTGTAVNAVTTFVAAINQDANGWTSTPSGIQQTGLPASLTDGVNAIAFSTHVDNWQYDCSVTAGFSDFLGSQLNVDARWVSNDLLEFTAPGCVQGCGDQSSYPLRSGPGYSVLFNGTTDYIDIGSAAHIASAFTFEFWMRSTDDSPAAIMAWGNSASTLNQSAISVGNGASTFLTNELVTVSRVDNLGNITSIGCTSADRDVLFDGSWHHVSVSFDGSGNYTFHIDGVQFATTVGINLAGFSLALTNPNYGYLGARAYNSGTDRYFDGELDEIRLWHTELPASEIRSWMCRKLTNNHDSLTGLASYYRLDENSGTTVKNLVTGFNDTLQGFATGTAWNVSGAAIGNGSSYSYAGTAITQTHSSGDFLTVDNYGGGMDGIHVYVVEGAANYQRAHGAQWIHPNYHFGVFKVGDDTTSYDVTYSYANTTAMTSSPYEFLVGLAKRANNADSLWVSQYYEGETNTSANTVFLPNQTGTHYAGIVSANNALHFDGANDYVNISSAVNVPGPVTVEAWVKVADANFTRTMLSTKSAASVDGWRLSVLPNEQVEWWIGTSSGSLTIVNGTALDTSQWHHIAAVFDGDSSMYLYVNGVLANSRTDAVGYINAGTNPVSMGRMANATNYFQGRMDEVRIWTRELCGAEINNSLSCQFDTTYLNLQAYYSFNQGIDSDTNTGLDSLIDQSGNGNNGTLNNFALVGSTSNWVSGSTGITGICTAQVIPALVVMSEGDTIFHPDLIPSALDSTNFGQVAFGSSFEVTYDLINYGGDTLHISSVSFGGPNAGDFSAIYPATIDPGGTAKLRVGITATTAIPLQADVLIYSDDCDVSPYTFRIEGSLYDPVGALRFDGTNDYVQIPYAAVNNIQHRWTLEGWFKPDSITTGFQPLIAKDQFPNPPSLWLDDQKVEVWMGANVASITSTADLVAGEWVHIAATYDQGDLALYINGALDGQATYTGTIPTNTTSYFLGRGESTYYFQGEMDEVRIWNRARSLNEVANTMYCELDGDECNLVHYYNFNLPGAFALDNNTGLTTLGDSANNGGNGTLTNFSLNDSLSNWIAQIDSVSTTCSDSADVILPIVLPYSEVTVNLLSLTEVLTPAAVDSASCDYYSGIDSTWVTPVNITCGMTGDTGYLFVQDSAGGIDSAWFILNVVDLDPPVLYPQNVVVILDPTGNGSVLPAAIDSATFDNCQVDQIWTSDSSFTCADIGTNTIWFYASDTNGNVDSTTVQVNVIDNILPTVGTSNITVYLAATGSVTIDTSDINNGSNDICGIDTMWLDRSTFYCADTSLSQTVWLFVQDNGGNVDSASAQVTVLDTLPPVVNATNLTVTLGPAGFVFVDTASVNTNSWDNCAIANMTLSQANFACADTSTVHNVVFTVTDVSGNSANTTVQITVVDATPPVVIGKDTTIFLDPTGNASIDTSYVHVSSDDNCQTSNVWLSQTTFDCSDVVAGSYPAWVNDTLRVTSSVGAASSAIGGGGNYTFVTFQWLNFTAQDYFKLDSVTIYPNGAGYVEVELQNTAGTVIQRRTLYVNPAAANAPVRIPVGFYVAPGNYRLAAGAGTTTGGLFRNSGGVSYPYSVNNVVSITGSSATPAYYYFFYDWQVTKLSAPTPQVWLYARDVSGNVDSTPVVISVIDTFAPSVTANNLTVSLDPTGSVTIDTMLVNAGSSDQCGLDTMWLSRYTFTCADTTAPDSVWLYAQDYGGNYDSALAMITVQDLLPPFLVVTDTTVSLDSTGTATIDTTFINNGSWDNCAIDTMWLSQYTFSCSDTSASQTVTFFARDISGNVVSTTAQVTVLDANPPAFVTNDTFVILDPTGNASIDTNHVFSGAVDNCTYDTVWLSRYNFTCNDIGPQLVTVYVQDQAMNVDSQVVTVTVQDTIFPQVNATNFDVYLDSFGMATIDTTNINTTSNDVCLIDTMWLSRYTFDCSDTTAAQPVWLYVQDFGGNVDSALSMVGVVDNRPPFLSTTDTTIYLDASGSYTIDTTYINVNTWDNCNTDTMWLSRYNFSCADTAAPQLVMFYAQDERGNVDSVLRNVTVLDTTPPIVVAKDTTIYLDATGQWTIDTSYVHVSSSDNCDLNNFWLSRYTYSCSDASTLQNDTLFVSDISGNITAVPYVITVLDTLVPVVNVTDTTIYLDATGNYTIDTTYINNGSWDNCYIDTMWLSRYDFSCGDTAALQSVRFFAQDSTGNVDSADVLVTVIDTLVPVLVTTDTTIYLDGTGSWTIDTTYLNDGSWDNCAIDTMWLSRYDFSCVDTAAGQSVTFYARDVSGNVDSIVRTVTVLDTTPPIVVAKDTTIYLDATGQWTIDTSYVHVSSSDNCDLNNFWLSRYTYSCSDASALQNDTLFVSDISGNITAVPYVITVLDTLVPVVNVTDTTIYLDATGNYTIDTTYINNGSWDNCYIDTMWLSRYDFSCGDTAALQPVRFFAQDSTGNVDSADVLVTVIDTLVPVLVTTDTTIYLDGTGSWTIDTTYLNDGSWDNCAIDTMWLSRYDFSCVDTAAGQSVTFYARDVSSNVDSIVRTVTVLDTTPPIVVAKDTTIYLDATGQWTIDTSYVHVSSSDNCDLNNFWLSRYTYSCSDASALQNDTLFVSDISGNITAVPYVITVLDTLVPVVNVTDTTIYLDATGNYTIDTTYINNGSWDNCYIDTMWLSRYDFSCDDTAALQSVRFFAQDSTGNVDSADVFVTVVDTLAPFIVSVDTTIWLDSTGNFTIDTTYINDGTWDNCAIDTMWLSRYDFNCLDTTAGQSVTFYARDISGNVDSISRTVMVRDSIRPVLLTTDTTIYLDPAGSYTIDTTYLNVNSWDNCSIDTMWLSRYTFSCADTAAPQAVLFYARDVSGNVDSITRLVTVYDTLVPVLVTTDTTIYLDPTGSYTIDTTYINTGSWDNCEIDTMWLSRYDFSCTDTAFPQSVTFWARDISGNVDSITHLVTVVDSLVPVLVTTDTTIYLDSSGNYTIDTTYINTGSWDNCEIDTMWLSRYDFSCVDTAAGQSVTFFARDVSGNVNSVVHTVTVIDTIRPVLVTTDTTIYLDPTGSYTIDTTYINTASWDNCEIDTMWLSRYDFSCADTAFPQSVTFWARDISGNVDSVTHLVTVIDTLVPVLVTTDTTIYLDPTGSYTIDTTYINTGSWDNCEIDTMWLSRYDFSCTDTAFPQSVTFWARDISGNVDSITHLVTVVDSLVPVLVTTDTTIYLDSSGNYTIDTTYINTGSWDNCEIDTMWLSRYDFSCVDTAAGQSVTFFARDVSGNVNSVVHTVTVIDTIRPVLVTTDTTIYLDPTGSYTIDTTYINTASWDNCEIDTMWLSRYDFSCADTAFPQSVTFWARDISGNVDSVTHLVTVIDTLVPVLVTTDTTIYLDPTGSYTIDTTYINTGSWDNCEIDTMWLSRYDFSCTDTAFPQSVTFWARDISGNVDSITHLVTVVDSLVPVLVTTDTTIYLDSSGNYTIDTTYINTGSWDNCEIDTMWLSRYDFSCVDTAAGQIVTFFARDVSGNVNSVVHTVTVIDTIRPVLVTTDTTIYLDPTGSYTIDTTYINTASWDNCEIDTMWLSRYDFSCADTAFPQSVTFWARDISGNVDSVTHLVTVIDTLVPVLVTTDTTVYLDATGSYTIDTTYINTGSWDNCEIDTMWLSRYDFSCGDTASGQPVTFFARDISGNVDSVTRFVTVIDTLLPVLLTTDTTIYLDSSGNYTIDTTYINVASWDNCEIDTMWLSRYDFSCVDTAAGQSVTFFARDVSGNVNSIVHTVTVIDTLPPALVTTDTTIYLDPTGSYTIDTTYINTGTWDNCEVDTMWLSRYDFSCTDTAFPQPVMFWARDISGNVDSVTRFVTVRDTLVPVLLTTDTTVFLDATGNYTIDTTYINTGSWDNCEIDTMWLSRYDFTCGDTSAVQAVTFYARDISGNVDSVVRNVTVFDTLNPLVFGRDITVSLDSFGVRVVQGIELDSASYDNCNIDTFIVSIDTYDCSDIGAPIPVTLTVIDESGNRDSATYTITVIDDIAPEVITNDLTVYLDANGADTISWSDIDSASWDSCGIASYSLNDSIFECTDVGTQVVTLTVTDIHGNSSSATATVTILDTIFPTVLVMTDTIFVDSFGNGIITPDSIDAGSFDNCPGFTRAVSVTNVGCNELGTTIPVDLIVTDASGNVTTVTTTVFVYDTIPPVPHALDITVNIDSFGYTEIFPPMVIDSLLDSCDIDTVYLSVDTVFCTDVGDTVQVVSYAIDSIGNIGTDTSYIYVFDVFDPVALLNDTVIYLADASNGNGSISIDSASLDSASWDNCSIASIQHQTDYDCSDLGVNTITVTLEDIFGNVTTTTSQVTVLDTVKPHAFARTLTRYLTAAGTVGITSLEIDSNSYDNCGIVSRTRTPNTLTCADVNDTVQITFTATDASGNTDTAYGYVRVLDTIRPTIFASDTTLYLDSAGFASVTAAELDAGTFDNCTVDSIYLSDSTFNCGELGNNAVYFIAIDIFGNRDSSLITINVQDTVAPVIVTQNDTVWLDATGTAYTSVDSILISTSNACGVDTVYLSDSIFYCADTGINNITITSVDVNGNSNTVGVTVLVLDTISPTILVSNDTLYLDNNGLATLDTALFDDGSFDNCGIASYVLSETNFDCDSAGLTLTIGLTVTDLSGNVTTATVDITVLDTVAPVVAVQDITVQLDSFGYVAIDSSMIDNGTFDACGIQSLTLSDTAFTCADVGGNTITFTAVDVNGNVASDTAVVTVQDNISPHVITTNDTVALDATGSASITLDSVRVSSSDACGVASETLSVTSFDCSDVGSNAVTLTVTDSNGNATAIIVNVEVIDTIAPTLLVADDTLYLNAAGTATLDSSLFEQGSFDNCGIASYVLSETNFDCDSAGQNLSIGLTLTDPSGNITTGNVNILVLDTVSPNIVLQNITVYLDSSGNVSIDSSMIDNGTTDACGIQTIALSDTAFACGDVGGNTVVVTVTDVNGNVSVDSAVVTVQDTIAPHVVATNDTIALDATGTASITLDSVRISSTDACGVVSETLSVTNFDCSDVGANAVTLAVTDTYGNTTNVTVNVEVIDTIAPTLLVADDTLFLNAAGTAVLDTSIFETGSFDNCGIASYALSETNFDCDSAGQNLSIGLTLTDPSGNTTTGSVNVLILDTVSPAVVVQNITVQLDSFGNVSIDSSMIDNGTSDACGIQTLSLSDTAFTCADVGLNTVVFTATDVHGNVSVDSATVDVQDNIAPVVVVMNDTVALDASGTAIITVDSVRISSTDACGVDTEVLSQDTFTCADVGSNTVNLTVTDVNGNASVVSMTVLVIDTIPPTILAQDDTLYLDAVGTTVLDTSLFDLGSFDNCGIATYVLSQDTFDCSHASTTVDIGLTVTDVNGNSSVDTIQIHILDTVAPNVIVQNITIQLDSSGNASIDSSMIDNGSTDACGIQSMVLSQDSFDCSDVGNVTIGFTATDVNGNVTIDSAVVTVQDNIAPDVVVVNDTIAIPASGLAIISLDSIRVSAFDACGVDTEVLSQDTFTCAETGLNNITLTVTDVNGNATTLGATVYVIDTIPPTVLVADDTLFLDASGQGTLDTSLFDLGSFDNCAIVSYIASETNFDCDSAGQTLPIALTVTDASGNVTNSSVNITVWDTVAPNVIVQNITVQLDSSGNASIDSSMIDNGTSDACGIQSLSLSDTAFTCADVGNNTVVFTATDVNGNVSVDSAVVTVEDNIAPAVVVTNDTIALTAAGTALITLDSIRISSSDACGVDTEVLSDTLFDCSDVGLNTISLTVTDVNGNATVMSATVLVIDTTAPTIQVSNATLYLDASGQAILDTSLFDTGTFDNCGIASYVLSETNFDCDSAGQTLTIGLTVTDVNGNASTSSVDITVLDTVAPAVVLQDITIQLDSFGDASIDSSMIDNGSSDACLIATMALSQTDFDCSDVGANTVVFTATDVNGNVTVDSAVVTVEDNIAPAAFTYDTISVYLDQNGADTIVVDQVDSASSDACGIASYSLSDTTFYCSDIGIPSIVTLTLTDNNGNVSSAQTVVQVFDTLAPLMQAQDITIYLGANGNVSITPAMVDNGSTDNCSVDTLWLSQSAFDCSHTSAAVAVTLFGQDQSGNVDSASAFVTVVDSIAPVIACQGDTTIFNDLDACGAVFSYPLPTATDTCGIDTIFQIDASGLESGDEFPVGVTMLQYVARDVNGNTDTCTFHVTVLDTQPPVIVCPADTAICDSTFAFAPPVITDNCPNDTLVQIAGVPSGGFYPVGLTVNTFVVTDASGLTDTCSFSVMRYDFPSVAYAGEDTALCEEDSLVIIATAPAVGTGKWMALTPGTSVADTAADSTVARNLVIGNNVFVWSVSNGVCAINTDTLVIRVDEAPDQAVLPGRISYCQEDTVSVFANDPVIGTGHWNVLSGGSIDDTLSNPTTLTDMIVGTIDVEWVITNGVCPETRDTQRIENLLNPTVELGEDMIAFSGYGQQMTPITSDADTFSWSPVSVFDDPTAERPTATVSQTTTISLLVTNDSGCTALDTVRFIIMELTDIPTGITPNGDGVNDVWNIGGIENYPNVKVYIYDLTGRTIFESDGYEQPWDGTFRGKPLPRASYYWIIDLQDGVNEPLKGILSIIK